MMSQLGTSSSELPSRTEDGLKYTALLTNDISDTDTVDTREHKPWSHGKKSPAWFWVPGFVLLSVIIVTTFIIIVHITHSHPAENALSPCGQSPSDARAKGCHFEPMMSAWIPAQCVYPSLMNEYPDIFSIWSWYSDSNLTAPITSPSQLDELRAGNYSVIWTSRKNNHEFHCLYAWRKTSIALNAPGGKNGLLDTRSYDLHHSTHCAKGIWKLLEGEDPSEGTRHAINWPLMFHDCVSVGGR